MKKNKAIKKYNFEIRKEIPEELPIFCRISAIDGQKNGWTILDSIKLAKTLNNLGVDVIDCSSGGIIGRPRFAVNDKGEVLKKIQIED